MTDISSTPGQKFDNGKLIFIAMIVSSAAISIVSAYETYLGLLDFMGTEIIGKIFSGILTFGIQVLLFAISWSIANHLKDGFRANIPRWIIWVLCAFFSGYFSYYGFFETTGGRNDDTRMVAVNAEVSDLYLSIEEQLVQVLETNHDALIAGDEATDYKTWTTNNLRAIIEVANDPSVEDQIAEAARQARANLTTEQEGLSNQLTPLLTERARLGVALRQINNQLEALRGRKVELESSADELRGLLSDAEAQVTSLQAEYDTEILTGTGPRARALELDLNSAKGARNGLLDQQNAIVTELATLEPQLAEAEALAEVNVEQRRLNELEAQITEIESEITRVGLELEAATEGVTFDFRTQSQEFDRSIAALANKDYSKLDVLVEQCAILKQQLTEAGLGDQVTDIRCSNPTLAQGVSGLQTDQDNLQAYRAQCMQERPQPERDNPDAPAKISGVLAHLDECVDYIANARDRDAFKARVGSLNTRRGDSVEPITKASVALFQDRQGNAVMSAIFAIIVDVLVLFCALVGLNVGLPERARAIDLMLGRSRKPDNAAPNVEKQINLTTLPQNHRSMMDSVISDLLRQGLAEFSDDEGTQLNLLKGATKRLTQMRRQEVSDAADKLADSQVSTGRRGGSRGRPNSFRD